MDGSVVGSEAVLIVTVVDSHFNSDRGINQPNYSCQDADKVCVAAVGSARELGKRQSVLAGYRKRSNHPATSLTSPPPTTKTGS